MSTDYSAKIRDHLTQQRRQASTPGGTCCYRTERDGRTLMCAVGCLIPDDKYSEEFEGLTVAPPADYMSPDRTAVRIRMQQALPEGLDMEAARMWQQYHDGNFMLCGTKFSYVAWCDSDTPAISPAAFYEALRVYLADKAEVQNGDS